MTASGPGSGDTPDQPDGTPSVPEYVWRLFLEDDERAIRASAPREPAARDRFPGRQPEPPAGRPGRPGPSPSHSPSPRASDTVGEAWRPEDRWAGPAWRELDGRARVRRAGRVLGTAAAVALGLTAWSQLTTGPVTPGSGPAETIGQRLEESPALPSAGSGTGSGAGSPTDSLAESLAPTESAAASPAVFDPAPSAIPRAPASS
ncbi:hypothetical protein LMJ38_17000 [Streptomyces sp. R1]|uniref:hypothetical protein n=1 Tax=unclassified Streptomyces TaxID=2593676 RepID=UPI001E61119A|nr:hypothetical protein [Streptomyces sp. R1]MCC8337624.1 hypothetical protein [Streptomyces sp. R1]